MIFRKRFAVMLLGVVPMLSGCYKTTRLVPIARAPEQLITAPVGQLLTQTDDRYAALKTMTATVQISASTGGSREGKIVTYGPFAGHMLMRKPNDLRILLSTPVLGTRALDMVTDGKTFKMVVTSQSRAITGSNEVSKPSQQPLENLRPGVFLDAMFVKGPGPGEVVSRTTDTRLYQPNPKKKDLIEEPDYDLAILRPKTGGVELQTLRVIHFGRSNLLPYQQDIYDKDGQLATQAFYENYQNFDGLLFPTKVTIKRPIDQLSIMVTVSELHPNPQNPPIDDTQFEVSIPASYKVQALP